MAHKEWAGVCALREAVRLDLEVWNPFPNGAVCFQDSVGGRDDEQRKKSILRGTKQTCFHTGILINIRITGHENSILSGHHSVANSYE